MFGRLVVSLFLVAPTLAAPIVSADTATPPLDAEVAELLAEQPAGEETLIVTKVARSGKPLTHAIEGVDTVSEVEAVVAVADALGGGTIVEWDGTLSIPLAKDPRRGEQWGHDAVGVETAWNTATGEGVVVAVVDTGVSAHPDLAGRLLTGYDFVGRDTDATDGHGHGTHVAGIVAAVADNEIGVAGAAPGAMILPVRVLDDGGSGSWFTVANGITWAADNGADVINLSLGGTSRSATITQAVEYARSRGVVVVVSAGNDGDSGTISWPGAEPGVIAVAAAASTGTIASFSSRGDYVDVAAPGQSILSTLYTGDYGFKSGTSMAAPYVAGLAALVIQAHPDWSEARVRQHIEDTAVDIDVPGPDPAAGKGLVSFSAAIPPAPWDAPAPASVTATVSGLDVVVTASTVDAPDVAGYQLTRNGLAIGVSTAPSFIAVNGATVDGVSVYGVRAINSIGQVGTMATTTVTIAVPGVPTVSAATQGTTIALTPVATGSVAATGWMVYRNGSLVTSTADTGSVLLTDMAYGSHTFTVRAVAPTGASALSTPLTVELLRDGPGLSARRVGFDTVVTAEPVPGATSYRFTRNGTVVATGAGASFTDTGRATSAGTVTYGVTATVDGASTAPSTISHTVTLPVRPTLTARTEGSALDLVIDAPGATELFVYRDGALHQTIAATDIVTIPGAANVAATWTVRSANATGVSVPSNDATITTPIDAPASLVATRSGIDLRLEAARVSGASNYEFFRDGVLIGRTSSRSPRLIDAGRATIAGTYEYSVRAVTSRGVSSAARITSVTVAVPNRPIVAGHTVGQTVYLTISASGATGYDVYRDGRLVATRPAAATLVLVNQPYGTKSYTVRATNTLGVSAESSPIVLTSPVPRPASLSISRSGTDISLRAARVAGVDTYEFFRDGVLIGRSRSSRPAMIDVGRATIPGASRYEVRSVSREGLTSDTIMATWTVTVPAVPTASLEVLGQRITFSVSAPGATTIDIYRNGRLAVSRAAAPTVTLDNEPVGEHTYTVRAASGTGVSAASSEMRASILLRPFVTVTGSGADLVVSATPVSGARLYEFARDGVVFATNRRTTMSDPGRMAVAGVHRYEVTAILSNGRRSETGSASFTVTVPDAPVIVDHTIANRFYPTLRLAGSFGAGDRIIVHSNGRRLSVHDAADSIPLQRLRRGTYVITVQLETSTGLSPMSTPVTIRTS
jgi:type VII secretion-associated serine protease mycosin